MVGKKMVPVVASVLALITLAAIASAGDKYWIASVPGNWSGKGNWSNKSGGDSSGDLPVPGDNINFDGSGKGSCLIDAVAGPLGLITIQAAYLGIITQKTHFSTTGDFHFSGLAVWDVDIYDLVIGGNYIQDGKDENYQIWATEKIESKCILKLGKTSPEGAGFVVKGDFTLDNAAAVRTSDGSKLHFYGNYTAKGRSGFDGWQGETVTFCGKGTKSCTLEFPSGGLNFSNVNIGGRENRRLNIFGTMRALSLQAKAGTIGGTGTIIFYSPTASCYRYLGATWADSVKVCMSAPGNHSQCSVPAGNYPELIFGACSTYTMAGPVECKDLYINCGLDNAWTTLETGDFSLSFSNLYLGNESSKLRAGVLECSQNMVTCYGAIYFKDENSSVVPGKSTFVLMGTNTLPAGGVIQPLTFYNLEIAGHTTLAADCTVDNDLTVRKEAVLVCGSKKLIVKGIKNILGRLP